MSAPRRRAGAVTFLVGALTALGGARLFAPRAGAVPDPFGERTGRGEPGIAPSQEAASVGHEQVDADARSVFRMMGIYGFTALASVALMMALLHLLQHRDSRKEAGLTAIQRTQTTPPEPNLQADPVSDIARLRTHEYQLLHSFARIDADTARIPIDRAIALTAGQTLDRPDTQGDGRLHGQEERH